MTQANVLPQKSIGLKTTFAALKHPNFRLWFIGQIVSLVGTWMQSTAQGYLVYTLTGSAAYLGYVGFASGLPTWMFTLYGGVIADRLPRRTLLIFTQSAMMILAFGLAGLLYFGKVQPWMILVMAFLLGIANAFDAPARQAFVSEMVPREDMTNAIALNSTMFNSAAVVGPAVAGLAYAAFGAFWCFLLNGVSFIAVIIALALMHLQPTLVGIKHGSAINEIKIGLKYALGDDTIRMLLSSLAVVGIFGFSMVTLMPAWAVDVLHGDVTTNGLLISARGLGSLGGALMIATISHLGIRGKIWTVGSLVVPIILVVFALVRVLPVSLALLAVLGWGLMSVINTTNALVQSHVPDEYRGRVMGLYMLVFMGGIPIGSLLVGTLADLFSEPVAIIICAVILMIFSIGTFILRPRLRNLK